MDYDKDYFDKLQAATIGLGLTDDEKRTLQWLAGWDQSTVKNILSIITKAKEALQ